MTILVTGVAGFIGSQTAKELIKQGVKVVGIDNLNDYYDVSLKQTRLDGLGANKNFYFECIDVADRKAIKKLISKHNDITAVIHLASQVGVRHSLIDPYKYTNSNIEGQLVLLENCRKLDRLDHFVYASSSSVYGGNNKLPFSIRDSVDTPLSVYAASKRAMELLAYSYANIYAMPVTGLRFFTVYGPWGRPDMAAMIFIRKILAGNPIPVFNKGNMRRDFTYIDDIVAGILACLERPPVNAGENLPWRVYNLGNNRSEPLMRFISVLEDALGKKAEIDFLPMQTGDVKETYADIIETQRDLEFDPKTTIDIGLPKLVTWYREYYGT